MIKKTIGVIAIGYAEKRNFLDLQIEGYEFTRKWDIFRLLSGLYYRINKRPHKQWNNKFYDFDLGHYNGLHFFNAISHGKKPWVTTFENYIPRGAHERGKYSSEEKYINSAIQKLNSPSCKKLIALSNYAKQSQINYLKGIETSVYHNIINKIQVIHPAQQLHIQDISEKPTHSHIKMVLVGADFFRKGGLEILQTVDKLLTEGKNLELTIISTLQYGDYASLSTFQDKEAAITLINKYPEHITHYTSLPNKKVLELFKVSNLALLPSYGETYGYSVLEAQACGCPVITTNGGAFNEINNNDCGWVIEVPIYNGRSVPKDNASKALFSAIVKRDLESIISSIIDNPEICKTKGSLALKQIRSNHDPEDRKNMIKSIYDKAFL